MILITWFVFGVKLLPTVLAIDIKSLVWSHEKYFFPRLERPDFGGLCRIDAAVDDEPPSEIKASPLAIEFFQKLLRTDGLPCSVVQEFVLMLKVRAARACF